MILGYLATMLSVAAAIYFIHSMFKYTRMISHIFLSLVYRPTLEEIYSSRGEKITILDSADREIDGIYLKMPKAKKLIIFCPESGGGRESWEKYAYFITDLGYSVLSVDVKTADDLSQKNNLSQWPCEDDVERLLTVIRWAKKACDPSTQIVLFGVSNGADIALAAAERDTHVRAVIADGLFSMKEILRDYIRRWAPMLVKPAFIAEKLPEWIISMYANLGFWYTQKTAKVRFVDVEKILNRVNLSILMVHGSDDDYVSKQHQELLEKIAPKNGRLVRWVAGQAKHNEAIEVARRDYEMKVEEFLEKLDDQK